MTVEEEIELQTVPPLCRLPQASRERLLASAIQHRVAAGTVLFEQGELPTFQIVVLAGSVQLFGRSTQGREVLVEVARAPDLIIPAAVVTGAPYLMQARVPEPSRLLLIPAALFRDTLLQDPLLAHEVIDALARQFRRMVRQVKNLKLRSSVQRVGCYLLTLSKRQGTPGQAVLPYEKNLIASELGITRESFSRALANLEQAGIRVNGQTIMIVDATRLATACQPDSLIDDIEGAVAV
ncbi:MAG TPA: helix-turn-helix domain-containing protein [Pseudomonadales bacterium]|nr:helix-turn-helix domain-containing protein [Pseudomonadales bacterium]HMU89965.1 helix-turn-helix domain-containing protein [Pseudomonadales bacterium]HMW15989.1 helix-turn-helix domain-containing protein [Pseudomonadales bacterium]HMW83156.1 helix-turn-helix domain-containing protein [Pseudomonadales bacterium]HMY96565.1 helix-turn-helix domain-containing protein [Pseudomonadales bacterium]